MKKQLKNKISRREFMLMAGASAPFFLSGCGSYKSLVNSATLQSSEQETTAPGPNSTPQPSVSGARDSNVLFICVDDLNDWVDGFNGYTGKVYTPNLDRLSKMGVTFQKAYCAIPWCAPSRAATLTGLSPSKTGYYGSVGDLNAVAAFKNVQTLPQFFLNRGYKTYGGGKVFHGQYSYSAGSSKAWDTCGQEKLGWTQYKPFADETRPPSTVVNGLSANLNQFDWTSTLTPLDETMPDMVMAKWAANILSQPHDGKFFLAPGFYRPHLPWYAPKKYYDLYPLSSIQIPPHLLPSAADDLKDVPPKGRELANPGGDHATIVNAEPVNLTKWREAIQGYLASISFADACIGVVLDALLSGPHAKTTTVVLWSDNGFQLGEKRGWRKFKLWEKSARVPLIIATPDRLSAGQVCRKPVSLMDLFPTLTDLCAGTKPSQLDGNSLAALLKNPNANWGYGALTSYSQAYDGSQVHRSVRTETHRYILYYDGTEELYDHRVDPNELTNLLHASNAKVAANRGVANALKAMLPQKAG